jgi:predicted DNA-binding antitoxin AbrB/MazE fold protein
VISVSRQGCRLTWEPRSPSREPAAANLLVDRPEQAQPDARRFESCISARLVLLWLRSIDVTQKVEAIYAGGVLKPTGDLRLQDQQRVRLTVETIDEPVGDREAAVARLKAGIASMRFFSEGPLPSREELHDRD